MGWWEVEFKNAAAMALSEAANESTVSLLEPIDRLDMILSSCGSRDSAGVQWPISSGITSRKAKEHVVGDLSGILLKKPAGKAEPAGAALVDEINKAWMGVSEDQLRAVARKSVTESRSGLVLCCIGANKAPAVCEIIRRGLASRIVLDYDCADKLESLL